MRKRTIYEALKAAFDVSRGRARFVTIRERILTASRIDGIHLCQLIAAMVIASVGLNIDSTEAVIGAMLICPLMGSVIAIAYGIATLDHHVLRRAMAGMALQCGLCLVTSTIYFLLSPLSNQTSALLTNSNATIWDVLIALVGGFAGALGLSRRQEPQTLLAGVAVATALMPPLCSVGYGLASAEWVLAASALYEFLINVLFIAFGATVVLVWLGVPLKEDLDGDGRVSKHEHEEVQHESHVLRMRLAIMLAVFAIPCLYFTAQVVQQSLEENGTVFEVVDVNDTEMVTHELQVICPGFMAYNVGTEDSYNTKSSELMQRVVATVVTSETLNAEEREEIEELIALHVDDLDEVVFEVAKTKA